MPPDHTEVRDGTLVVRIAQQDATHVLALGGELDLANSDTFAEELAELEGHARTITVDLRELEFIDSTGIALLVAAHARLNTEGETRLRLVASEARAVRRVLEVTGVDARLPFLGDAAFPA